MRRLLAGAALLVLLAAPAVRAQDSGFSRAEWTDPAPSADRAGTPLAYLERPQQLTGVVVHENGISRVTAVLVPDPTNPPADGCDATVDPNATLDGDGVTFHVNATFPCNLVYEVRASAQSNPGTGIGARPAEQRAIPLLVAVAIPPAPVASVDAVVEIDGDDRSVVLEWPGNAEPDLLGYVITRDGESLGQVNAGDATRFTDTDPPGGTTDYAVVAYRQGPDEDVKQVPSSATAVSVELPPDPDEPAGAEGDGDGGDAGGDGGAPVEPSLAGEQQAAAPSGRPLSLSTGRAAGQRPPSLGTPTTLDTGFQETLPFDTSGGDETAIGPNGDPAVVATFEEEDILDEKQRMSFIAGGLAVLVGASVILHVTRRAAREAY